MGGRPLAAFATLFLASMLGGLVLRLGGHFGTVPWMLSRASGIVAFVLLSGSILLGLSITTRAGEGSLSRPFVFTIHQFLSVLSLTFVGVHAGALLFDGFFNFGPLEVLVPFAAPYQPFWVGLGVIAAWAAAAVTGSFWARKRIGQRAWRRLHYASFAAYVLSLGHSIFSGSDTSLPVVWLLYAVSATAVAALLTYRVALARPASRPAAPARRYVTAPRAAPPAHARADGKRGQKSKPGSRTRAGGRR